MKMIVRVVVLAVALAQVQGQSTIFMSQQPQLLQYNPQQQNMQQVQLLSQGQLQQQQPQVQYLSQVPQQAQVQYLTQVPQQPQVQYLTQVQQPQNQQQQQQQQQVQYLQQQNAPQLVQVVPVQAVQQLPPQTVQMQPFYLQGIDGITVQEFIPEEPLPSQAGLPDINKFRNSRHQANVDKIIQNAKSQPGIKDAVMKFNEQRIVGTGRRWAS